MVVEEVQSIGSITDELEYFLKGFSYGGEYVYVYDISQMMVKNTSFIEIDYQDLEQFNPKMADMLRDDSEEVLKAFNQAAFNVLKDHHFDYSEEVKDKVTVRIKNFINKIGVREINTDIISKLITVSGMVVRTSEVKPLAKRLVYICPNDDTQHEARVEGLEIIKPTECIECGNKKLELRPELSEFIDFQFVRLQELPEDLPAGQLPHYVEVIVKGNLVDVSRPGDRVLLTGTIRIEQDQRTAGIFHLRMEGNNVEYLGGLDSKSENLAIDTLDEQKILEIAAKPDAYNRLIGSFAPNIYGLDIIKESILLLICGSVARKTARSRRGDINLFLIGDPGTGKSELLKFAGNIAPRGIYTSGRGTTAAGLTAAVIKDKTDMMVLEAGATVLGDQGLVCIDEMDKIRDEDRSALHEVMEQQTCSVAKGGIVATLNARTSILAAGNPQGGKYDTTKSVAENIHPIPIPLLTRFDIIHIVMDKKDAEFDSKVTDHILRDIEKEAQGTIDMELFRKYLSYTKKKEPKLGGKAIELLGEYYKKMRAVDSEGMMTVTPRQLEGLVRLATARARLLLKDTVDEEDAERAIYLVGKSLEAIGIDVNAGIVTKQQNSKMAILDIAFFGRKKVTKESLIKSICANSKLNDMEARRLIQEAYEKKYMYEVERDVYAKV